MYIYTTVKHCWPANTVQYKDHNIQSQILSAALNVLYPCITLSGKKKKSFVGMLNLFSAPFPNWHCQESV